ncbi:globin domain-containing protein [Hamadaea tsunoensis]|uniref:globin domain-containing protein n=1 Tax=Hamadaea tsunoensis TaxID=53368 RepID=UPI00041F3AD7|nr:globin domain-containing protein [Hamadaea tsunoensis]
MTPDQVALVRGTMRAVHARRGELADAFYANLFRDEPGLRPMFPDDLSTLQAKFVDELEVIVGAVEDIGTFLRRAGHLGGRHVGYGVRTEHYRVAGDALVGAFEQLLAAEWTPAHEVAWRGAYDMVAEAMMMRAAGI